MLWLSGGNEMRALSTNDPRQRNGICLILNPVSYEYETGHLTITVTGVSGKLTNTATAKFTVEH